MSHYGGVEKQLGVVKNAVVSAIPAASGNVEERRFSAASVGF
jgi:hypothetical protein